MKNRSLPAASWLPETRMPSLTALREETSPAVARYMPSPASLQARRALEINNHCGVRLFQD